LATVINATKIIVMEHGKIVEEGTHQTLLQKPESIYKKLYEAQFGEG
jgi:ABC-type multidrug transport system fused ATPase/permease subunit